MRDTNSLVICLVDIFDWNKGGHFRSYFRLYSRLMLEAGHQVIAICSQPEEIAEWVKQHLSAGHAANFSAYRSHKPPHPRWLPGAWSTAVGSWIRWRTLSQDIDGAISKEGKEVDGVFLMFFEDFASKKKRIPLWILERTFRWPWGFLSINSRYYRKSETETDVVRKTRQRFHPATSKNCKAWCFLDEKISEGLRGLFPKSSIHLLADPTDEGPPDLHFPLAQEALKQAGGRKIVSLLGLLDRRKGLLTLVRVAKQRPDIFFLIAGLYREATFSEGERKEMMGFLDAKPANCLFRPERINVESQFNGLVAISDILFTAYVNFQGSSNVMTKAARFRKPVIVTVGSLCHERVERYHLGVAIAEGSHTECSAAIDHLLSDAGRGELRDYDTFTRSMSLETFKGQMNQVLSRFTRDGT